MKSKKIFANATAVVCLMTCITGLIANAATKYVDLTKDKQSVYSGSINDTYSLSSCTNAGASSYSVKMTAQYKSGGSWHDDNYRYVAVCNTEKVVSFVFNSNYDWRLELKSNGDKNCSATGWIQ